MSLLHPDKPALILAPMEGVTDAPMRALLTERGGFSYCVSEFLRISQAVPGTRVFLRHVPELEHHSRTAAGVSVQVQLLGGDPERLAQSACVAVEAGAVGIDLNFGCPAKTVNRNDGGATLLRFPERLRAIVAAVRRAVPAAIPVSAKLRLGWEDPSDIDRNAAMAAEGGASWLTIHGRTRAQGYKPPAYWEGIGRVRRRLGIPVVANGEIWTVDDLRRCHEQTGCTHYMIGRGALADPALALRLAGYLGLMPQAQPPPVQLLDWQSLVRRFTEHAQHHTDRPRYVLGRIKQWCKMSHQRFPNSWYGHIKTLEACEAILQRLPTAQASASCSTDARA